MSLLRRALAAAAAAAATYAMVRQVGGSSLQRTNFRDEPVTLAEGPAVVAGLAAGAYGDPLVGLTAIGSGALGFLDDVVGSAGSRGLRGHLRALVRGEITTGAVKVGGLGLLGLVAAGLTDRGRWHPVGTPAAVVLVAGGANLVNLFDLRPGRALKVAALCAVPLVAVERAPAGAVIGTLVALAGDDLAGRSMMGDTGANPLGAVLGLALARAAGWRGRLAFAAVVTGLTLASERVSFSAFIASRPVLRAVDEWGATRSDS